MEKAYAYIGAAVICMTFIFNVYAADSNEKSEIRNYRGCAPVFVEIDYSYLREGEWIGEEFRAKIKLAISRINTRPDNVKRNWGLVNCQATF